MTELEKLYEDIGRLLEANLAHYKHISKKDIDAFKDKGYNFSYIGNGGQVVLKNAQGDESAIDIKSRDPQTKKATELSLYSYKEHGKEAPQKSDDATNAFLKKIGMSEEAPQISDINKKFLSILDPNSEVAKTIQGLGDKDMEVIYIADGQIKYRTGYSQEEIDAQKAQASDQEVEESKISFSKRLREEDDVPTTIDNLNGILSPEVQEKLGPDTKITQIYWEDSEDSQGLFLDTADGKKISADKIGAVASLTPDEIGNLFARCFTDEAKQYIKSNNTEGGAEGNNKTPDGKTLAVYGPSDANIDGPVPLKTANEQASDFFSIEDILKSISSAASLDNYLKDELKGKNISIIVLDESNKTLAFATAEKQIIEGITVPEDTATMQNEANNGYLEIIDENSALVETIKSADKKILSITDSGDINNPTIEYEETAGNPGPSPEPGNENEGQVFTSSLKRTDTSLSRIKEEGEGGNGATQGLNSLLKKEIQEQINGQIVHKISLDINNKPVLSNPDGQEIQLTQQEETSDFSTKVSALIGNNEVKQAVNGKPNLSQIIADGTQIILESQNSIFDSIGIKLPDFLYGKLKETEDTAGGEVGGTGGTTASVSIATRNLSDVLLDKYKSALAEAGVSFDTIKRKDDGSIGFFNGEEDITSKVNEVISKVDSQSNEGQDVQTSSISNAIKSSELIEIAKQLNEKLNSDSPIEKLDAEFANAKVPIVVRSIKLGDGVKGTYIQESLTRVKEAEETEASKTDEETKKKETPKTNIPSGGAEFYVICELGIGKEEESDSGEESLGERFNSNPLLNKFRFREEDEEDPSEDDSSVDDLSEESIKKALEILPQNISQFFNEYKIKITAKVKDEGISLTGMKNVETEVSFQPGPKEHQKLSDLGIQDGKVTAKEATAAFTLIVNKGNAKDKGNFWNKFGAVAAAFTGSVTNSSKNTATGTNRL